MCFVVVPRCRAVGRALSWRTWLGETFYLEVGIFVPHHVNMGWGCMWGVWVCMWGWGWGWVYK